MTFDPIIKPDPTPQNAFQTVENNAHSLRKLIGSGRAASGVRGASNCAAYPPKKTNRQPPRLYALCCSVNGFLVLESVAELGC